MGLPLNEILVDYICETFIETGTECGNGIRQMLMFGDIVTEIHSIELDENYFKKAKQNFSQIEKINLYNGNSLEILPTILEKIEENRAIIWLDAHDNSHAIPSPLMDELDIIKKHSHPNNTILIDDMSQVGNPNSWGRYLSINSIKDALLEINPQYIITEVKSRYELSRRKESHILIAKPHEK